MMNIICVGLAIALGLAIKELRNKATEIKMYEGMSEYYFEKSNYLEEIVAEYGLLECGKTTVEEYDTIPESKGQCKVVSLDEYRR